MTLIVLEGPDNVGKTTLAKGLCEELGAKYYAFPGRQSGTLGAHIYDLHHNMEKYGINGNVPPECLQLLHITAHIEAIYGPIQEYLQTGQTVILDRFWWSTWVYGVVYGADPVMLDNALKLEHSAWCNIGQEQPTMLFLVDRSRPYEDQEENMITWDKLRVAYLKKFNDEYDNVDCTIFAGTGSEQAQLGRLLNLIIPVLP